MSEGPVLVVRTDPRLGNALLTLPLLDALAGRWPSRRRAVLLEASVADVAEGRAEVLRLDRQDPRSWLAILRRLRSERFSVAIDATSWHARSRSAVALVRASGAPRRIGFARSLGEGYSDPVPMPDPSEPEILARLRLLGPLGLDLSRVGPACVPPLRTHLSADATIRSVARARLSALGIEPGRRLVGIYPGSRKPDRRVPMGIYEELVSGLRAHGIAVLLLWGPRERRELGALARATGAIPSSALDLPLLGATLRELSAYVGNDTGPTHLAVAVGTPAAGLHPARSLARFGHPDPPNLAVAFDVDPPARVAARVLDWCLRSPG